MAQPFDLRPTATARARQCLQGDAYLTHGDAQPRPPRNAGSHGRRRYAGSSSLDSFWLGTRVHRLEEEKGKTLAISLPIDSIETPGLKASHQRKLTKSWPRPDLRTTS